MHCVDTGIGESFDLSEICFEFDDDCSELSTVDICNKVLCFLLHLRQALDLQVLGWWFIDLRQLKQR